MIVCDSIIANKAYDNDDNSYKDSDVRAWLNAEFYNTAFTDLQREIILTTTVDNSVSSTGTATNPYACEDTDDKIFLLSHKEVTNTDYGFVSRDSASDSAREMNPSDYSRATGAYVSDAGTGYWWLRSPNYSDKTGARYVYGGAADYSYYVSFVNCGVVPALRIMI